MDPRQAARTGPPPPPPPPPFLPYYLPPHFPRGPGLGPPPAPVPVATWEDGPRGARKPEREKRGRKRKNPSVWAMFSLGDSDEEQDEDDDDVIVMRARGAMAVRSRVRNFSEWRAELYKRAMTSSEGGVRVARYLGASVPIVTVLVGFAWGLLFRHTFAMIPVPYPSYIGAELPEKAFFIVGMCLAAVFFIPVCLLHQSGVLHLSPRAAWLSLLGRVGTLMGLASSVSLVLWAIFDVVHDNEIHYIITVVYLGSSLLFLLADILASRHWNFLATLRGVRKGAIPQQREREDGPQIALLAKVFLFLALALATVVFVVLTSSPACNLFMNLATYDACPGTYVAASLAFYVALTVTSLYLLTLDVSCFLHIANSLGPDPKTAAVAAAKKWASRTGSFRVRTSALPGSAGHARLVEQEEDEGDSEEELSPRSADSSLRLLDARQSSRSFTLELPRLSGDTGTGSDSNDSPVHQRPPPGRRGSTRTHDLHSSSAPAIANISEDEDLVLPPRISPRRRPTLILARKSSDLERTIEEEIAAAVEPPLSPASLILNKGKARPEKIIMEAGGRSRSASSLGIRPHTPQEPSAPVLAASSAEDVKPVVSARRATLQSIPRPYHNAPDVATATRPAISPTSPTAPSLLPGHGEEVYFQVKPF